LIPRYVATGRMAPNGTIYSQPITVKDESKLVPVRSIVTKYTGDPNIVTPDLLSKKMLKTDLPDGSAIGLSFGSSFSEATTQSILGLKHGQRRLCINIVNCWNFA